MRRGLAGGNDQPRVLPERAQGGRAGSLVTTPCTPRKASTLAGAPLLRSMNSAHSRAARSDGKWQARPPVADLPRQFLHLGVDEEARIAAGERVDHLGLLLLVADHVLPARQRHRHGMRRGWNRAPKLLALPDRVLQ